MINWEKWRWMFFPDGGTCRHLWHVEIIANWLSFSYAILWQHFNRQLDERYWNFKVFNKKKYNLNEYKLKKCSSPYLLQISINTYQQYTTTCTSSELSFNHSKRDKRVAPELTVRLYWMVNYDVIAAMLVSWRLCLLKDVSLFNNDTNAFSHLQSLFWDRHFRFSSFIFVSIWCILQWTVRC